VSGRGGWLLTCILLAVLGLTVLFTLVAALI
jgi:hypothetical protein